MADSRLTKRDRHGRPVPAQPKFDTPMKNFAERVGNERLAEMLSFEEDPKFGTLLTLMMAPESASWSFPAKCKAADVTLHELQRIYNDSAKQAALMALSDHLPAVAADIAEDAKSTLVECDRCEGSGEIPMAPSKELVTVSEDGIAIPPDTKKCTVCDGVGQIRKAGNKHARDLMFQSTGLVSNGKMQIAAGTSMILGSDMDANIENVLKMSQAIVVKVGG